MEVRRELSSGPLADPLSDEAAVPPEAPGGPRGHGETASPPGSSSSLCHRERRQLFERQLSSASASTAAPEIDMPNLRALASAGLPEKIRAVAWKLLLGYLPPRRCEWAATLAEKRGRYAEFCSSFVVAAPGGDGGGSAPRAFPTGGEEEGVRGGGGDDHPLSQAPDSRWGSFFRDADLVAQIARDVARTHPGMHFFRKSGGSTGRASRRSEMARALLVFAKLNPGLSYVQDMNEVLAPLFYHCALEEEEEEGGGGGEGTPEAGAEAATTATATAAAAEGGTSNPLSSSLPAPPALSPPSRAEADAFWCLVALMGDFRDNFLADLDRSPAGVAGSLARVERALRAADPALAAHVLDRNGMSPHFFAFRWVSLLLTQEFELPDVARLWDYLLAVSGGGGEGAGGERGGGGAGGERRGGGGGGSDGSSLTRPEALARLCAAMLLRAREPLLRGDFAANLKLLQRYPPALADVRELLAIAGSLPAGVGRDGGSVGGAEGGEGGGGGGGG